MKIARIEMSDFRGVKKGDVPFTVDLTDVGKNLLLYGENGSGKSTIALALDRVVRARTHDFKTDANRFRRPDSEQEVFVTVTLSDGKQYTYGNTTNKADPLVVRSLMDAQLRCGFLGYKVLLRTSFYSGLVQHSLFQLLVTEVLADHRLIIDGSSQAISTAWRSIVRAKPRRHREYNVPEYHRKIDEFNKALSAAIAEIETTARTFLAYFTRQKVQLRLEYNGAKYNEDDRKLVEGTIVPHVEFGSDSHTDFSEWLNEARLSCLALCLHLASVKKRDIAPAGNLDPLRILCLDDVLIGLDMSNRRHVLQILTEHFSDFQVFLTTYDRHWFEIAKKEVGDNWLRAELYEGEDDAGDFKPILITPSLSDYGQAKAYFEKKDYAACANYLRKVCEAELKRFVPEHFLRGEQGRTLGALYNCFLSYMEKHNCDPAPYNELRLYMAIILNPFSHADINTPVYRGELMDLFAVVERLRLLQNIVIADADTLCTTTNKDAAGTEWSYTVRLKEPLRYVVMANTERFLKCEAKPHEWRKDGALQDLSKEADKPLKRLHERYVHACKPVTPSLYDDFKLLDGQSLADLVKQHTLAPARNIEGKA